MASESIVFLLFQGLVFVGSPGLGYVWVRSAVGGSEYWKGWKRLAASLVLGWGSGLWVYTQQQNVLSQLSFNALMEHAFWLLLAVIFSASVVGIVTRFVWKWSVYVPAVENASGKSDPAQFKASRLRSKPARAEKKLEAPVLENDVLDLLKEEKEPPHKAKTPKERNAELGFRLETSEFEGFDETMEQLRKDIKAFNQSLGKTPEKGA